MLNEVPRQVNRSARIVTLRHPNAMPCEVWRKQIARTAATSVGGTPTIGGIGVLSSEDEAAYTYEPVGDGKVLFSSPYTPRDKNWDDSQNGTIHAELPIEGMFECILEPTAEGFIELKKDDVLAVDLGGGSILLYFECVGITGSVNIPPYTKRYVFSPKNDRSDFSDDYAGPDYADPTYDIP